MLAVFVGVALTAGVKNLAKIKPPVSNGRDLIHPEALSDDDYKTFCTQWSHGKHAIQWNFRGKYELSLFLFKLEEGVKYLSYELLVSNHSRNGFVSVKKVTNFVQGESQESVFMIPTVKASHIKFVVDPGDGKQTKFAQTEIWGIGEFDESPTKYNGTRGDTVYTKMVWNEEFDGPELNRSRWRPIDNVHFTHHVFWNDSIRIMKDGDNSYLAIKVKNYSTYENLVDAVGPIDLYPGETIDKQALTWAAGRIESKDMFAFQHGRVAIRAKCTSSRGHWDALWMLAQDERGHDEIDILESPQMDEQNAYNVHTTNHYGRWHIDHWNHHNAFESYEALSESFHVYEVEWDMDSIRFFYDGVKVFETTKCKKEYDAMHNRPMYLIIDTHLSRGGASGWGGAMIWDKSNQEQEFLVDWVRVYQKPKHNRTFCDPLISVKPGYKNTDYLISPVDNSGTDNFLLLSDGKEQWEDRHNFFYDNGMPFDERSRVAVKPGLRDQYLIYNLKDVHHVHFSVYYQTLPDKTIPAPQDQTPMGVSILDTLQGGANLDFSMFISETGTDGSWTQFDLEKKANLVYVYPVFSRITYDAYDLPPKTNFVKVVFPNYEGVQYQTGSGKIVDVVNTDIQLSKIVFVKDDTN